MANDDTKGQGEDFAAMFAESERAERAASRAEPGSKRRQKPQVGERVRGKVVSIGRDTVFVELEGGRGMGAGGGGGEAMLDMADVRDDDGRLSVAVGDTVEAMVVDGGEQGGALLLRRGIGRGPDASADLGQAFQNGIPVEGTVTAANKGGVEVSVAGMRAFCPVSQLELRHVDDASQFVGQKLAFRITRYEEDRRGVNIVLSRRALLEEEARARGVETRARLAIGVVLPGVVTALKDYGAFVDLGGIEGMLHVSEIGYERTTRPADVLSVGQRLTVQVIRIEKKKNDPKQTEQIALSLKSLEADPWDDAAQRFTEGSTTRGTVTRVTPFGAFVELAPGVEGLLHVSVLGDGGGGRPLRHARDAVKPGDAFDVTITAVDRERRRLSLAPATGEEALDQEARAALTRAAAPARLGTLGDLFKDKGLPGAKR
jgi:small subunit ribosomal protein S1